MKIDFHLHYLVSAPHFLDERLRLMDEAQVAWSVLHPLPHLSFTGAICGDNADVLRAVNAHPRRFVGSIYLDPRERDCLETLERYAGEGFRCVKMWPPIGFYPDTPRFAKVFERIQELGLPILFHAGLTNIGRQYDSKYADPIRVEGLVRRYPETKHILAHWGGLGTFQTAWAMMKANRNVYLDASTPDWSWPGVELYRLYSALTPIDFGRVVWGTDNLQTPGEGVRTISALLGEIGKEDHALACLGETAKQLLRLP